MCTIDIAQPAAVANQTYREYHKALLFGLGIRFFFVLMLDAQSGLRLVSIRLGCNIEIFLDRKPIFPCKLHGSLLQYLMIVLSRREQKIVSSLFSGSEKCKNRMHLSDYYRKLHRDCDDQLSL